MGNTHETIARNKKAHAIVAVLRKAGCSAIQAQKMNASQRLDVTRIAKKDPKLKKGASDETWALVISLLESAKSVDRITRMASAPHGKQRAPVKKSTPKTKTRNALLKAVKQNRQSLEFFIRASVIPHYSERSTKAQAERTVGIHREGLDEILIALKSYLEVR